MSDTDPSPPPSEEEIQTMSRSDPPKPDRATMTDRELLLSLHERIDDVDRRLEDGNRHFTNVDADWTIAMHFLHEIALERGRADLAQQIDHAIRERRPTNGATHDEPTNPGTDD
jgi:hypothetical protein